MITRDKDGKILTDDHIRRSRAPEGECKYCDKLRAEGETFAPEHDPSDACASGKRPHCSCDGCF